MSLYNIKNINLLFEKKSDILYVLPADWHYQHSQSGQVTEVIVI